MINTFFGIKKRQTRYFDESGKSIPVSEIFVEPLSITQVKSQEQAGYSAIQVGFGYKTSLKTTKPESGHLKKTGKGNFRPRYLREIKVAKNEAEDYKLNDTIAFDQVFAVGDSVKVTGVSKAKGFAGVVKRHGFAGGPRTHGQSDRERAPGSIGQTTTPGRVYKGKRMAGRMGNETVTISGLKIIKIDKDKNTVLVKGLIPGVLTRPVMLSKT